MGLSYPTSLMDEAIPLETLDLGHRGNAAINLLQRHGFSAYLGPTTDVITEIQAVAKEPDIVEYCPNDQTRFTDTGIISWLKKQRILPFIQTPASTLAAYGWIGPEENKIIPTAPITTAYRATKAGTTVARELRRSREPNFRIGKSIGELVLAVGVTQIGVHPSEISLETWKSNHDARRLYDDLGFVQKAELLDRDGRPTLHDLGESIDGYPVFIDPDDANARRVVDSRCYYVLENY